MRYLTDGLHATFATSGILSRVVLQKAICLGLAVVMLLPGCQYSSHREAGTALGGGIGALTGAMLGQDSGHFFGGALLGGLAGGIAGGMIGHAEDEREQREAAAVTHAQYLESTGQVLTNVDIIRMVQCGVSDEVIIGTIKHCVGKYDLSSHGTIQLKAYGTSDRVILALQKVPPIPPLPGARFSSSRRAASVGLASSPGTLGPYYHDDFGSPYQNRRDW